MSLRIKRVSDSHRVAQIAALAGITTAASDEALLIVRSVDDAVLTPVALHGLRTAATRLRSLVGIVAGGYRFDDERSSRNLELLGEAHDLLQGMLDELEPLFTPVDSV